MSRFVDLVPEPFDAIISLLSLPHLVALWLCGDSKLCWRMSKGKAVREVEFYHSTPSTPFWPVILRHFDGLETFSYIKTAFGYESLPAFIQLSTLARNLQSLNLSAPTSISTFNDFISANPFSFPSLKRLVLIDGGENAELKVALPQTVTNLVLGSHKAFLGSLSLSALPSGLISLTGVVYGLIIPPDIQTFPQQLQKLDLKLGVAPKGLIRALPVSLTDLAINSMDRSKNPFTREDWEALGRISLISLQLEFSGLLEPDQVGFLPRTLETLALTSSTHKLKDERCCDVLQTLPKSLKKLSGLYPVTMSVSVAECLPSGLEMEFYVPIHPSACHILPSKTKAITISPIHDLSLIQGFTPFLQSLALSKLTKDIASKLPDTLRRIIVLGQDKTLEEDILALLPSKLAEFHVASSRQKLIDKYQLLKALPRSLTYLGLESTMPNPSNLIPLLLPYESEPLLLHGLKSLYFSWLDISQCYLAEWLQGCLQNLKILSLCLKTLPQGSLAALRDSIRIIHLNIRTLNTPKNGWLPHLADLPRNLNYLCFEDHSPPPHPDAKITNEAFQRLPKTLSYVTIPYSSLLDASCAKGFQNLKEIYFFKDLVRVHPDWYSQYKT